MSNYDGKLIQQKKNPADYSSSVFAEIDGLSAYEVALNNGFIGTENEWLTSLEGPQGEPGPGLPVGGVLGQILAKNSPTNYDTRWADPEAASGAPAISTGPGSPTSIPAKIGDIYVDLTNDQAYIAVGFVSSADWKIASIKTYVDAELAALKSETYKKISHGADANYARPIGWSGIIWVGTVNPLNASGDDIIIRVDEAV